jgi:hypothetical protein
MAPSRRRRGGDTPDAATRSVLQATPQLDDLPGRKRPAASRINSEQISSGLHFAGVSQVRKSFSPAHVIHSAQPRKEMADPGSFAFARIKAWR